MRTLHTLTLTTGTPTTHTWHRGTRVIDAVRSGLAFLVILEQPTGGPLAEYTVEILHPFSAVRDRAEFATVVRDRDTAFPQDAWLYVTPPPEEAP